jgi:hypothetical protein
MKHSASIKHAEHCPGCLRDLAFRIEDALDKKLKGISIDRPQALIVRRALFDLADRVELEE